MSEIPADQQPQMEQPVLPPITFTAGGATEELRLANLESVLPSPGYPTCAFVIADAITKRTEMIVFDFGPQSVVVRFKIDGMWHQMPTIDRQTADYMLATLKQLAGLNFRERRARQQSSFGIELDGTDYKCRFISQGIKTGERVALTIRKPDPEEISVTDLGMRPKMKEQMLGVINQAQGLAVIASMPGDGFTTTWKGVLAASDRFMRDVVAVEPVSSSETDIINVRSETYNPGNHETPLTFLPKLLLKQPDAFAFTEIPDGRTLERYCDLVLQDKKMVFTRINAKHAIDTLLRLMQLQPNIEKLAKSLTCVVFHRLIRLLCQNCKQGFSPNPAMLQRLGIPPGRVGVMYTHFQLRPEDAVDEKGQPIEIQPCSVCGGLGYFGRTAIYELLVINDRIRDTMIKNPTLEGLMQAARDTGHITLRDEGIVVVAKGETSIEELQRILKK